MYQKFVFPIKTHILVDSGTSNANVSSLCWITAASLPGIKLRLVSQEQMAQSLSSPFLLWS